MSRGPHWLLFAGVAAVGCVILMDGASRASRGEGIGAFGVGLGLALVGLSAAAWRIGPDRVQREKLTRGLAAVAVGMYAMWFWLIGSPALAGIMGLATIAIVAMLLLERDPPEPREREEEAPHGELQPAGVS